LAGDEFPEPRRILIIKPSAIGDVVHALPVLPRLRRRWPKAKITWLVTPLCAGLVENHPLIDEVILFDRHQLAPWWHKPSALAALGRFAGRLRAEAFDLVIDLQGLFRSGWISAVTGAPWRAGFSAAREFAPLFYTQFVDCSVESDHAVQRYLKMASALGCEDGPVEFTFAVDDRDRNYVQTLLPDALQYAVLLPGANWDTKRWPAEKFAQLVTPLRERFGLACVTAGAPGDGALATQVAADFDLTGKTNLRQTVALLERSRLVIGNDTGPMHIAAALAKPLIAPYGPTDPRRTGPFNRMESVVRLAIPCSPCFSRTCSHHSCLQWLTIDPVLEMVTQQMQ
jgi:lipopolysaccharide heptosyltransferase I